MILKIRKYGIPHVIQDKPITHNKDISARTVIFLIGVETLIDDVMTVMTVFVRVILQNIQHTLSFVSMLH